MSALFLAADHPERVSQPGDRQRRGAGAVGAGLRRGSRSRMWPVRSPPSRSNPTPSSRVSTCSAYLAPSVADDVAFRAWWDAAGNRAASPSMAAQIEPGAHRGRRARQAAADHRADADPASQGLRRSSRSVTAATWPSTSRAPATSNCPARTRCYWVGDSAPILDEIEEFITGVRGGAEVERVLTTIVFTDIVGSTQRAAALGDDRWHALLDNHDTVVRHELERFRGIEVNTVGDGFVAMFTSPSARHRLRGRDRRRGPIARHRGAGGHPRRRGRGARRRHRRHGRAHRRAGVGRWRDRARCWCPRRCARSSRGHGRPSTTAASTTSRACRAAGGCTPWCAN